LSKSIPIIDNNPKIALRYTGSAYATGSYSGSIIDPYYQYAYLDLHPRNLISNLSASVYLPFFDGEWWSVMVKRTGMEHQLILSYMREIKCMTGVKMEPLLVLLLHPLLVMIVFIE
jgi:hypothetical protein